MFIYQVYIFHNSQHNAIIARKVFVFFIATNNWWITELEADSVVELTVSKGKETVEMPNLVGKDYLAYALPVLQQLRLKVTTSEEYSDAYQAGTVISQSPQAGAQLSPGATVTLVISIGPEPTEPPTTEPIVTEAPSTEAPTPIQTDAPIEPSTEASDPPGTTSDGENPTAEEQG